MNESRSPIERLRTLVQGEEFDYLTLLRSLEGYTRPRDKITKMLRRGDIIRVKKGIYVFGDAYARRPYSGEVLANMIYGPSYVSLEYALQHHGLIPEGVEAVTSMTTKRPRRFRTPVGLFIYRPSTPAAYPLGVDIQETSGASFLIAVPEKALADKVRDDRGSGITTVADMERYLLDDLRIDAEELAALEAERLDAIAAAYQSHKLRLLSKVVRRQCEVSATPSGAS